MARPAVLDRPIVAKLVRYAMASMVGVVVGQTCLFVFLGIFDNAAAANFLAVAISSVPAYLINRYWVWQKTSRNDLRREVVPFWGMAFLGLILSTIAVTIVEDRTEWKPAIMAANLAGFGVLWIAKFFVLDRVLFTPGGPDHYEPPPLL